ncbi:hypothetical protein [Corynebacterium matruchotii]
MAIIDPATLTTAPIKLTRGQVQQALENTTENRTPLQVYKLQKALEQYQGIKDQAFQRDHGASICRYWQECGENNTEIGGLNQFSIMIGGSYFNPANQEDVDTGIFDALLGENWRQALRQFDVEDFREIYRGVQVATGDTNPQLNLGTWTHPKTGETRHYVNNWLELCGVHAVRAAKNHGWIEYAEFEGRPLPASRLDAFTRGKVWLDGQRKIHVNIPRRAEAYLDEDTIRRTIGAVQYANQGVI